MSVPFVPPAFAELAVASNYSFLRGASHAAELVATARELGLAAIGIADRNSLAGAVRAHVAAKEAGLRLVIGARLVTQDGIELLAWPADRAAYGSLCALLTEGNLRAPKGECHLSLADILAHAEGIHAALIPTTPTATSTPTPTPPRASGGGASTAAPFLPSPRRGGASTSLPSPRRGGAGGGVRVEAISGGVEAMSDAVDGAAAFAHLPALLARLRAAFGERLSLAAPPRYRGDDAARLWHLAEIARAAEVPLLATNDVLMHAPARRPLADVLTCIREHCTIDQAGLRLAANAERHLKSPAAMAALFRDHPAALARGLAIADACRFSLDELRYEYPAEPVPEGATPQDEMERLTWEGAGARYPDCIPDEVRAQIRHEFALIARLGYAPYFLTVHDIVRFARSRGILCQGRGSAANSAVCYCLGITAIDPVRAGMLFERFISAARDEPPDIDVDFEHERREEVIQYIYGKYGRHRAGIAATVISWRSRSAIREVGKALGLSDDALGALAGNLWGSWDEDGLAAGEVRGLGLDPAAPRLRLALDLAGEIHGFPRHLSQHVGGFVLTRGPLSETVPIANAAMADRTMIEWDKDDLDALGILKVDVLALGILTCLRKCFALIEREGGVALSPATVPAEDAATYDMICKADTVGVFQIESRAQMSMLPRLRPRTFFDLVIEVAIVRPGPIQGDMVHPYLRRRDGKEAVEYPSEALRATLGKTLGVPLFQEQAMRIAMVAAGFTATEADALRRAMATFRHKGAVNTFRAKLVAGMVANGYAPDFAERCFRQIEGFGYYGFPESHAASFALLAYVSAWLKCHYPAAFACALLNSQPMGFYAPAQIVADARAHGVAVLPVCVNRSDWDCTLEGGEGIDLDAATPYPDPPPQGGRESLAAPSPSPSTGEGRGRGGAGRGGGRGPAIRLGFRQVKGLAEEDAAALVAARGAGYADPRAVWRRAGLSAAAIETLAVADAFAALGLSRRDALWAAKGLGAPPPPLFQGLDASAEPVPRLAAAAEGEEVVDDYATLRLTLRRHPLALLRPDLTRAGVTQAARLAQIDQGARVRVAGLVTARQRPETASGIVFATLEDETGNANIVIHGRVFEAQRRQVIGASLLHVEGRVQKEGIVIHVVAERCQDWSDRLARLLPEAPHEPVRDSAPPAGRDVPLHAESRDFR